MLLSRIENAQTQTSNLTTNKLPTKLPGFDKTALNFKFKSSISKVKPIKLASSRTQSKFSKFQHLESLNHQESQYLITGPSLQEKSVDSVRTVDQTNNVKIDILKPNSVTWSAQKSNVARSRFQSLTNQQLIEASLKSQKSIVSSKQSLVKSKNLSFQNNKIPILKQARQRNISNLDKQLSTN